MSNSKLQKLSVKFFNDALRFMELSKQLLNPEDRGFQMGFLCDYGHLLLMPWAKSFHVLSAGEAQQFLDHVNITEFLQACVQSHAAIYARDATAYSWWIIDHEAYDECCKMFHIQPSDFLVLDYIEFSNPN